MWNWNREEDRFLLTLDFHVFDCLFVCLFVCRPTWKFLLIWRHHHCRWRAANFDLCSTLMTFEQWGFFNVPHLLPHRPTDLLLYLFATTAVLSISKHKQCGHCDRTLFLPVYVYIYGIYYFNSSYPLNVMSIIAKS